jgi:hypothetical protein
MLHPEAADATPPDVASGRDRGLIFPGEKMTWPSRSLAWCEITVRYLSDLIKSHDRAGDISTYSGIRGQHNEDGEATTTRVPTTTTKSLTCSLGCCPPTPISELPRPNRLPRPRHLLSVEVQAFDAGRNWPFSSPWSWFRRHGERRQGSPCIVHYPWQISTLEILGCGLPHR